MPTMHKDPSVSLVDVISDSCHIKLYANETEFTYLALITSVQHNFVGIFKKEVSHKTTNLNFCNFIDLP